MFSEAKLMTSMSSSDLAAAKTFYGDTLGVEVVAEEEKGMLVFKMVGGERFMVYFKEDHAAASFTVLNFVVKDVSAAVDELVERGVVMDSYPEFGTDEKGVSTSDKGDIAWFKDPAGNQLAVVSFSEKA